MALAETVGAFYFALSYGVKLGILRSEYSDHSCSWRTAIKIYGG